MVTANVLACFYHYGRGHEFPRTVQYIQQILKHRTYENGSHYYSTPDCCLYFFSRLLDSSKSDAHLQEKLHPLLRSRVLERVGKGGSPLDLALRVLACNSLGVDYAEDLQTLVSLQQKDGSWNLGWMYRYGSTGVQLGNRGVTTAFAVKAIASSGTSTRCPRSAASTVTRSAPGDYEGNPTRVFAGMAVFGTIPSSLYVGCLNMVGYLGASLQIVGIAWPWNGLGPVVSFITQRARFRPQ